MVILFGQEFLVQIGHKGVLVVVADGQRRLVVKDDVILLHLADFFQVDDERAVDAHEGAGGQMLLDFLHAQ